MTNTESLLPGAAKSGTVLDFWNPAIDNAPVASWGEERTISAGHH